MKRCPICNAQYDSRIEYCFRDGAQLDAPTAASTAQKLMTSHLDSMGKHSMDSMETLDNISIDDLLQIGGGGFQGFGEFAPDGPSGLNSITPPLDDLQQNETESTVGDGVDSSESEDIENILESLGSDIGAHLEDTLDGIQVGQVLNDSSLDISNSNEILPGDTLDVLVDELDVPQMTESDLNRFHQNDTFDELDAWEASGPIMQEAARDALAHHRNRVDEPSTPEPNPSSSSSSSGTESTGGGNKILLTVGAAILVVSIAMWGLSGDSNTVLESETDTTTVVDQEVPEIPMVPKVTVKKDGGSNGSVDPVVDKDTPEPTETVNSVQSVDAVQSAETGVDVQNAEENSTVKPKAPAGEPISSTPVAQPKSNSTVTSVGTQSTKPQTKVPPKPAKKSTPAKPKVKKKPAPQKPKTKPKPIPQKDPQEDNGWGAVQSGGWGAETCGVTVKSNVSTAKVYIDGVQKGSVGKNLSVDCGQHKMEVRSEGYKSKTRTIDLTSDASFTIDLSR